jgi:hypothetical protein
VKSEFLEWIHERRISNLAVIQNGQILSMANNQIKSSNLQDFEFRVFSQWGEDVPVMRIYQLKTLKPEWFADEPVKLEPSTVEVL